MKLHKQNFLTSLVLLSFTLACLYKTFYSENTEYRRFLEEDLDETDEAQGDSVRRTIAYLMFFSFFGGAMFYIQKSILNEEQTGCFASLRQMWLVQRCCLPPPQPTSIESDEPIEEEITTLKDGATPRPATQDDDEEFNIGTLLGCVLALMTAYIAWGLFQERLMSKPYISKTTGEEDRFEDADFLVFCNRVLGLIAGYVGMYLTGPHITSAPPFMYAFCSMSNVLSSWFQYESLKFITFPMQVLAKSCKIIATMAMGKVLNGNTYSWIEIFNVLVITFGLFVFKYGQSQGHTDDEELSKYFALGMVLISCYVLADSFTSNWQQRINKQFKIHSFQMMVGVNMWSVTVSFGMCAPRLMQILSFVGDHPLCMLHIMLMSCCSAIGQLFIFYTINKFGAVIFATAMTSRNIFSVLISIFLYNHPITPIGGLGMAISFGGLIWKVWIKKQATDRKRRAKALAALKEMQEAADEQDIEMAKKPS